MKVASISPRIISFSQAQPQRAAVRLPAPATSTASVHEFGKPRSFHLTHRELEVLALLCEGMPNKIIARELDISTSTVKVHIGQILSELGVTSRLQAVVEANRRGLLAESSNTPLQLNHDPAPAGLAMRLTGSYHLARCAA
jgi:DNA-binding NarL/FixJ family response regulator